MITKKELIEHLEKLIKEEEKAVPFYTKFLKDPFFFKNFSEHKIELLKNILLDLSGDSEKHKQILNEVLREVRESKKDVF